MSKKPALVVMAAGMGSRYGGLKQMDPMDEHGHLIMDFSVFDAVRAGFEKVVFIIKRENLQDFKECIGDRLEKHIEVVYVFQDLKLPEGFEVPEGRIKPFGTGHAVLCCDGVVDGPFVVINADDFYGQNAFKLMYDFLMSHEDDELYHYAMAGFLVENTLTDSGYVSRGVCNLKQGAVVDDPKVAGYLESVTERTRIEKRDGGAAYSEDGGESWVKIPQGSTVSMNLWGFSASLIQELKARFRVFLEENLEKNPLKCEFFLPFVVNELLEEGKADVQVLTTTDRWYGVTYKEDKVQVVEAIKEMKNQGQYPQGLWN